jgi:non-ribosomal peptide synthase protein (TIGR01720 family)
VRGVLFDLGVGGRQLLVVLHHLVVDVVSWGVLLEDLERACRQRVRGDEVKLGEKTTSYRRWASGLKEYARTAVLEGELEHWRSVGAAVGELPVDRGEGENTVGSERVVSVELGEEETRELLREVPKAYGTEVVETLLTALAKVYEGWTGERELVLEMEGHGREEVLEGVDVTRTVGWFTSVYPLRLRLERGGAGEELKGVKEQVRGVPQKGLGYGLLRYLGRDEVREELGRQPAVGLGFTYADQTAPTESDGALLRQLGTEPGVQRSAAARREHLLEINGGVSGGRLRLDWRYSDNCHRTETVEELAIRYMGFLRELIGHCRDDSASGHTPSDFPLSGLGQRDLDKLLRRVKR